MLIHVPAQLLSLDVSTQYSYDVAPLLAAQESVKLVACFFALLLGADLPNAPGNPPATIIDKARCDVRCGDPLSATCAVNANVPALVGVPAMTPVDAFRVTPPGRLPATMLQLYGVVPPVAARACEYAAPTLPFGRLAVVSVNGFATRMLSDFVDDKLSWPVTRTVNVDVPGAPVGVPEITPVLGLIPSPTGG